MVFESRRLTQIVNESDIVIVDSSALRAGHADLASQEEYFREVRKVIGQDKRKIYTVREVVLELRTGGAPKELAEINLRSKIKGPLKRKINRSSIGEIAAYLKPLAVRLGVTYHTKKYRHTDVKLAALAFSFAQDSVNVAFLSSDRALNELVYQTSQGLKNGKSNGFPYPLQGSVKPFSLVQRGGVFIPYQEEREKIQEEDFLDQRAALAELANLKAWREQRHNHRNYQDI